MADPGTTTPSSQIGQPNPGTLRSVRFSALRKKGGAGTPLTGRRFTPYHRTPNTRRIFTENAQSIVRTPPTTDESHVKELLKHTWRVYKLTPLYKFSHKAADLKHYSKLLTAHIVAESRKGVFVDTEGGRADIAQFSPFKGLQTTEGEKDGIKICLKQKSRKGELKVVMTIVLCCVHTSPEDMEVRSPFTAFPLMLARGPVSLTNSVAHWLETSFDTSTSLLQMCAQSLSWMVAMWTGLGTAGGRQPPVQLKYRAPDSVEGLDYITLSVNAEDCQKLWHSIRDETSPDYSLQEVMRFIQSLETHFYHHFKIHLSAMELHQIGTAVAMAAKGGKIKIFQEGSVLPVLGHLTELAFERTLI